MVKVSHKQLAQDDDKKLESGKVLQRMRGASEEEQAAQLARQYDLSYVDLNIFPVGAEDMRTITEDQSRQFGVCVFQKAGKEIRMGVVDPANKQMLEFIEKLKNENGWLVHLYVI